MSEPDARNIDPDEKPPASKEEADPSTEEDPSKLSPEEQLRRYEESLKNDDWGHQPC